MPLYLFLVVFVGICIIAFGAYWTLWRVGALSFTMKKECVRVIRGLAAFREWLVWSLPIHSLFLGGVIATLSGLEFGNESAVQGGALSLLLFAALFWVRWRSA